MNLKNISKYMLASSVAAFMFTACGLDYEPVDTFSDITEGVTEEAEEVVFKNKQAVEDYMTRLKKKFRDSQEHWYLDMLLIAESHSDNAYAGTTGAECMPYEDNSIEGSNSVIERDWNNHLKNAADATKFIVNIDKVQDGSLSKDEQNRYEAQARIFRAMIWFDMVRLWGNIPIIKTTAGNITADNVDEMYFAYFPMQNTEEEAYQAIEEDLLFAEQYAPNASADKTEFSKGVAHALLCKLYAEKPLRDYSKVIAYADACKADGFALAPTYTELFDVADVTFEPKRNSVETIYEAQYESGSGNWVTWMYGRQLDNWDFYFTWAKWITPSRDLIKLYETNGDTERASQSIVFYACTWSNYYPADNYAFMYKCRSAYASIIKYRYADILLLKAEALIQTGDLTGAANIINDVRARVGLGKLKSTDTANKESMINALLDERRMELAFEGQRWFDLCRLDKVEEVMNAVFAKDSGRHAQKSPFNAFSYKLPIPQGAIDQNDNLVQNPGY